MKTELDPLRGHSLKKRAAKGLASSSICGYAGKEGGLIGGHRVHS